MENKKIMIPVILGVILLCGIVFTVVYKKTSGQSPNDQHVVETLAPRESEKESDNTQTIITESSSSLDDFDINEVRKSTTPHTEVYVGEDNEILSESEVASVEESQRENFQELIKSAESIAIEEGVEISTDIDESNLANIEETTFTPEESEEIQKVNDEQSEINKQIMKKTYDDAIINAREGLKYDVKQYAPTHPELQGITDEMIDNYSMEELAELTGKIDRIIDGY